jgi:hypothetical protein
VHERSVTVSGAPQFKLSALTPIQLAQQRYLSVIAENKSRDVTDRLTPEQLGSGIRTSHQLWNHYFDADRIQGCKPDVIDVLRTLPKRVFKIENGYLSWGGARYKSADFAATDFAKQIRKHEGEELIGYAFDISNLIAWVEVELKLIEVKYVPNVRETAAYSALTSDEVALHDAARKANKAMAAQARRAAGVHKRTAIPNQTGAAYRPTRVTRTRPKQRGPEQVAEMKAHRE